MLHVNSQTAGADVHVPFGGIKGSAASARTSRAAPRSSSTPRPSPSTSRPCERAVPRHGRARLHRRLDRARARPTRARTSSASTSARTTRRLRARARPTSSTGHARAGRHHRPRRVRAARSTSTRSRTSIHLAALQVPRCKADPPLGARVNVGGTVNVFEARRRRAGSQVAYASSAAVYDADDVGGAVRRRARAPDDALRRAQAGERGHGADLLAGRRRAERSASGPFDRLRPGPRPGPHRRADARDGRGRGAARTTGSRSAAGRSSTTRPTSLALHRRGTRRDARGRRSSISAGRWCR